MAASNDLTNILDSNETVELYNKHVFFTGFDVKMAH